MLFKPGELVKTKAGEEFGNRGGIELPDLLLLLLRPVLPHQALHFHYVDELESPNSALAFTQPGARGGLKRKEFPNGYFSLYSPCE